MSEKSVPPPNHTQTPNLFFDEMLSEIETMSELKVTLAIIRKTFGWHKYSGDHVSLRQLEQMTGMQRQQVVAGCKAALDRGYVWRKKREGRNYFGLNVGGYDRHTPMHNTHGYDEHTEKGYDDHTHKRKEKESVVSSNELTSGITEKPDDSANVIGLEKHVTDKLYAAMDKAGYTLDGGDTFKYHLGRAKKMREMNPTDEEIEALPTSAVEHFEIRSWTDAKAALRYMRQQAARAKRLGEQPHWTKATSTDKPRAALWYASTQDVSFEEVEGWIKVGMTHSAIMERLEGGVA